MAASAEDPRRVPCPIDLLGSKGRRLDGRVVQEKVEFSAADRSIAAFDNDGGLHYGNARYESNGVIVDGLFDALRGRLTQENRQKRPTSR